MLVQWNNIKRGNTLKIAHCALRTTWGEKQTLMLIFERFSYSNGEGIFQFTEALAINILETRIKILEVIEGEYYCNVILCFRMSVYIIHHID